MEQKKWIRLVILLAVIIIILVVVLFWPMPKKPVTRVANNTPAVPDIVVTMPGANDWVSSPLEVSGTVNGGGWTGFEGQVGTVALLDGTGKNLAAGVLTATTDWTKFPTNFDTTLTFNPDNSETGELVFKNENPSGMAGKNKEFILPVRFALGK